MSPAKIPSLKNYAIHYAVIIFVVVFLAASIHYFVYGFFIDKLNHREQIQQLEQSADSVTRLVEFYQNMVDKMAQQAVVLDLLQFGTDDEVQAWAVEMQRLVPGSIGLALFDEKGRVRGNRDELRLSDRCFMDLRRRLDGQPVSQPPVHYKIEHLAHFDIVSPVIQDGHSIGLVFVSFSLDVVERMLEGMTLERNAFKIIAPGDYMLASSGWRDDAELDKYELVIPGTDWLLRQQIIDSGKSIFVVSLLISNILAFVLVSLVLVFAINKLFRMVVGDFESISWMMHNIRNGSFDPGQIPRPHLQETAGIVRFVQHTGEELSLYQKKLQYDSSTDELTGLYNRRVLNDRMGACLQRAGGDEKIYVVILDLDYFKQVNDIHGHEFGDEVLKRMADVLRKSIEYEDLCARAGGDEFIAILDGYDEEDVERWYRDLSRDFAHAMEQLAEIRALKYRIGISAGCSAMQPGDDRSAVLKRADEALYDVKAGGRNHIICR